MIAQVTSGAVLGVEAYRVAVEVDLAPGLPSFQTVGLPDGAVREARVRVKSAIENSGCVWPQHRVTVNLAPANLRKDGTLYDLPMAVGLLAASGRCPTEGRGWRLDEFAVLGELSLSGRLRPVRGVLPLAVAFRDAGCRALIVPRGNAREAAIVRGLEVLPVDHLMDVVEFLCGERELEPWAAPDAAEASEAPACPFDFAEVCGQEHARRALEVAAAGGHNVLMIGPPGSGKTMLAKRIVTVLPELGFEEALETTKVYSISGLLGDGAGLVQRRPFRAPHHTISGVGLCGGGSGVPKPGEISLAHNGVLFLDELPEFSKQALETMRQPLEDQQVTITRSQVTLTYPSSVTLIASMNPCPCGYAGDPGGRCACSAQTIARYRTRLSGPLLDRIDLHVEVPAVSYDELRSVGAGESSAVIRDRVNAARVRQRVRFEEETGGGLHCNAQMRPRELRRFCALDSAGHALMRGVIDRLGMSARAWDRILKVARTIADLEGVDAIGAQHVAEAIQYRVLDRH